jgi:hypothetical protein
MGIYVPNVGLERLADADYQTPLLQGFPLTMDLPT